MSDTTEQPLFLSVELGTEQRDYSIGDLLNSIDAVVKYYQAQREQSDEQIAQALTMYADGIGGAE